MLPIHTHAQLHTFFIFILFFFLCYTQKVSRITATNFPNIFLYLLKWNIFVASSIHKSRRIWTLFVQVDFISFFSFGCIQITHINPGKILFWGKWNLLCVCVCVRVWKIESVRKFNKSKLSTYLSSRRYYDISFFSGE